MSSLGLFVRYLETTPARGHAAAIDVNHTLMLFAVASSVKPDHVLNLGIGPGLSAYTLLHALEYNGHGHLTCVDNNWDLGGNMPQSVVSDLRQRGATVVCPMEERNYVHNCVSDSFDLILSDADHLHAGEWVDQILRIARNGAFIFVHDADNDSFPGLRRYHERAKELGLSHYLFNKGGVGCEYAPQTGFLMMVNRK